MPESSHADRSATQQSATDGRQDRSRWTAFSSSAFARSVCALAVAMVIGDLVTTVYGLEMGLRERNPFVVSVMARFGVAGLVGLKLVAVSWVVLIWRVLGRRYGLAAMAGLAMPQGVAVVLNVVTIWNAL